PDNSRTLGSRHLVTSQDLKCSFSNSCWNQCPTLCQAGKYCHPRPSHRRVRPQRVCHLLHFERARQRLRPPQLPHHPRPGLPPHRHIRPQRVCHVLRVERARQR
ncbi:MAG: hypothetical protein ACK55Z_34045, partial [bacterium]